MEDKVKFYDLYVTNCIFIPSTLTRLHTYLPIQNPLYTYLYENILMKDLYKLSEI